MGLNVTYGDEDSVVICKQNVGYEYWETEEGVQLKVQIDEIIRGAWLSVRLFKGRRTPQVQTGKE
jgi:phage major head subunit gpT-like protein